MPMPSISLFRYRTIAVNNLLRHVSTIHLRQASIVTAAAKQQQQKPKNFVNKNLLRAKQHTLKEFSSLAPVLSPQDKPNLTESQAIGTVAAAQANFMRVIVQSETSGPSDSSASNGIGVELLCVVKAVLKKIKRRVLVGDKVVVGSIDWVDRRGMIENVFQRSTEILDPPVANVDHLLVLFSMDQPKPEPFTLTRFLVEADSTGIPLTLALNKVELVDKEVRYIFFLMFYSNLHSKFVEFLI